MKKDQRLKLIFCIILLVFPLVNSCRNSLPDGLSGDSIDINECNTCHGNNENAAPPISTDGSSETAAIGVGAHQSHMKAGLLSGGFNCDICHTVPDTYDAPGHIDPLPAEISWSDIALADDSNPVWDRQNKKCLNTYCHGATLSGGSNTGPIWTKVDGTQSACGTCHGNPPPSPHTNATNCNTCHAQTVKTDGTIDVAGGYHVDGLIQTEVSEECNICHGNNENAAPPVSTTGESATTAVTVGAHQSHLSGGDVSSAMSCAACHVVPENTDQAGHIDTAPAEIVWGTLAMVGGLSPEWDRNSERCSNTYCHGATLTGGSNTSPLWTTVDGSQDGCGTCHGNPPPPPHSDSASCHDCHPQTINSAGEVLVSSGYHINGSLDVMLPSECNSCHGNAQNAAPPLSTTGQSSTAAITVGAHQSHIDSNEFRYQVPCNSCHIVPGTVDQTGHMDASPAEITWSNLASAGGLSPSWNRGTQRCTNVYCHGASLSGGSNVQPIWTVADGSQVLCGTCHGSPPPSPHTNASNCHDCHEETIDSNGEINIGGGKHIDGQIQTSLPSECNACHGNNENGAPPVSTTGESSTSAVTVGAHQSHLHDGILRTALPCNTCHIVPANTAQAGHMDTFPAEISWSSLASAQGANPGWNRNTEQCNNVYCHGATLSGGTNNNPYWTTVNGSQVLCGTCHGNPPPSPHTNSSSCNDCHADTVNSSGQIDVAGGKHIDGLLQTSVPTDCNACHGNAENAAPPVSTTGQSSTSVVNVGAHQSHLHTGSLRYAIACENCHTVPTDPNQNGHMDTNLPAELSWSGLSSAQGASPSWDRNSARCYNTYCHGGTLSGGSNTAPTWTTVNGSQITCGTCHGNPPPSPHTSSTACYNCHSETITASGQINVAGGKHIDGIIQATDDAHPDNWDDPTLHGYAFYADTGSCKTCHGTDYTGGTSSVSCDSCHTNGTNAWRTNCTFCHGAGDNQTGAPPYGVYGETDPGNPVVGAHTAHVVQGNEHVAYDCSICHVTPASFDTPGHINGNASVVFSGIAGGSASYNAAQSTCNSVYCHGNGRSVSGTITWPSTDSYTCSECHAYYNRPQDLSGAHKKHVDDENLKCYRCHNGVIDSNDSIIALSMHINGSPNVSMSQGTYSYSTNNCSNTGCHGTENWYDD